MGRDTVAVLYHFQVGKDEGKSFSFFFFWELNESSSTSSFSFGVFCFCCCCWVGWSLLVWFQRIPKKID
ncbi:unnamed protein product, partial [Vitis vinifera]